MRFRNKNTGALICVSASDLIDFFSSNQEYEVYEEKRADKKVEPIKEAKEIAPKMAKPISKKTK